MRDRWKELRRYLVEQEALWQRRVHEERQDQHMHMAHRLEGKRDQCTDALRMMGYISRSCTRANNAPRGKDSR